jgi:hypothetical protein
MQTGVGTTPSTAFTGAGFAVNPASATFPGRLNSMAWETKGWVNGDLLFGNPMTNPAHARGSVNGAVITEGIYAFTDAPASVANPTLMIQPADGDFAPGSIALRVKNNGTANITQLEISYNLFIRNDENTSGSFNFSHSNDNLVYQDEPALDYVSPDTADAFQWQQVGVSPSRSMIISGINVAPGAFYYIRWSCADVSGTGGRDEFGLYDIVVTANYGAPSPEINVTGNLLTILNNDMTPSIPDGTQFANTFTGGSQSLTSFVVQNLGGQPLNISNVTITGANASDFTFFPAFSPVVLAAVSGATISTQAITIIFSPSAPGVRQAQVNITSNDSNENPYVFKIQGLGIVPQPDIAVLGNTAPNTAPVFSTSMLPAPGNCTLFSPQVIGGPGQTNGFKILNQGQALLSLTAPAPYILIGGTNPGDFTIVTQPTSANIVASFSKTFSIKFAPTGAGIRTAIVSIPNNDILPDVFGNAEGPYTFLIQGTGVAPEIDITGNSQPIVSGSTTPAFANHTFFDYLDVTTGQIDRVFTIQNTGTVALTLGALTLSGSPDFTIISMPAASVAIGGSTTFTIRFNPSAVGIRTATVSLVNDDYNENPYTFMVSGYGVNYVPCNYGAIETIGTQDFEVAPATPTWGYTFTGSATTTNGNAYGLSGDGGLSPRFIGGRSLQVSNSTAVVSMGVVNTTQYSDIEFNLRLSALSGTLAEGLDANDKVVIAVSTNGSSWSNEVEITGNTDSKWTFTSGTAIASVVYDGNNSASVFAPSSGGFQTTAGYGTISLTGLPKAATLYIRVTVNDNNANELWSVDNVSLFGRKEISTTWNGVGWNNGAPTATVKAIIDGNYDTNLNGDIHACKCEIRPGRNVTIQSGDYFNIESEIDNKGSITVENNGSLVQQNDFAVNLGTLNLKRITTPMTKFDYTYWSSPVAGQTLTNLTPLTPADKFYEFNPAINNWVSIPGSTTMAAAKGYIARAPSNFSPTVAAQYLGGQFIGVPHNGFIQTPIAGAAGTWNLIGNPYPSALDADLFLGASANTGIIGGTIYLWTHNTPITNNQYTSNDYAVYNLMGGIGTRAALSSGVNTSIPTKNIASGQGFFVACAASGQATFNNGMRLLGSNNQFFRMASAPAIPNEAEKHRIWLNLTNDQGAFKQTLVGYTTNATNGIDRSFDGDALEAGNAVSLYSISDEKHLSIQGRALPFDVQDKVPLGYMSTIAGLFTISIENFDGLMETQNIYLEDKWLGVIHDLKSSGYIFETGTGTFDDRFELRYTGQSLGTPESSMANGVRVAVRDGKIVVLSQSMLRDVTIYDLLGRKLAERKLVNDTSLTIADVSASRQPLVVKAVLANGAIVNAKIVY